MEVLGALNGWLAYVHRNKKYSSKHIAVAQYLSVPKLYQLSSKKCAECYTLHPEYISHRLPGSSWNGTFGRDEVSCQQLGAT